MRIGVCRSEALLPPLGSRLHPRAGNQRSFNKSFLEVILKILNVRTGSRQPRVLWADAAPGRLSRAPDESSRPLRVEGAREEEQRLSV